MKILEDLEIAPGEVWAVTGPDPAVRSAWCARLVRSDDLVDVATLLSFSQHAKESQRAGGWPAARYYEDEGKTVDEFLSYNDVYDINPFEIGARRPETRKAYRKRLAFLMRLLDLRRLHDTQVLALSNGETRRVLFARALAKGPKLLVLDDPAAGLDPARRAKLKDVVAALAKRGMSILFACRHEDELPTCVTKGVRIDAKGRAKLVAVTPAAAPKAASASVRKPTGKGKPTAKPVLEIRDLDFTFSGRLLFKNFSWTVRKGERWILRGANGSGKTTLFALITGDSPMAYAADITVFGQPRTPGHMLSEIRRRIGQVSPEMQACLGASAEELLEAALAKKPELLLLDEPFMNLDAKESRRESRRIGAYLKAHPDVSAIMICHRADEAPACFTQELVLG